VVSFGVVPVVMGVPLAVVNPVWPRPVEVFFVLFVPSLLDMVKDPMFVVVWTLFCQGLFVCYGACRIGVVVCMAKCRSTLALRRFVEIVLLAF
jgi:hypothetical protein